jgi:hypothetical protein
MMIVGSCVLDSRLNARVRAEKNGLEGAFYGELIEIYAGQAEDRGAVRYRITEKGKEALRESDLG